MTRSFINMTENSTIDYSDTTPDVTFTYDNYNRLETRTDAVGLYQYTYDANHNLKTIDGPWANDTITFNYDELGRPKEMIPQGGQSINYTYDTIGRLNNIQPGADTYTYGYTGVNPLIQNLTRPNGSITEYLYNDPLKRLTDVINKNSSSQVINSFNYTYNNLDLKGSETITNGDPITNFTEGLTSYNYNNVNQLLDQTNPNKSFTYDSDGNITQGYTPDGYVMTLIYDAENRLITSEYTDGASKVQKTEYVYSGNNLLAQVKKYEDAVLISDTRFVRAGFLPIQERNASNNVTREYTWGQDLGGGIGGLLNLKQGGADYSYLYDGKGNVMAVIDSSQSVVAGYRYDTFGKLMTKTGTLNQPFQFSTKRYDETTGLSYHGYRYYSPSIGRWITRDPIEEAGGMNLYGFVSNNPVNWVDPLGLTRESQWAPCNQAETLSCSKSCTQRGKRFESCRVRISYYDTIRNGKSTLIQKRGDMSCSCKDDDDDDVCESSPNNNPSPDPSPSGGNDVPKPPWWLLLLIPLLSPFGTTS